MLRSVRELQQFRVRSAEGRPCGRIKDIYFDDSAWKVTHLVLSLEPRTFGRKEVLIEPPDLREINGESGTIDLTISNALLEDLPLASTVLPVCKQYQALAFSSPGARKFDHRMPGDPHLRSGQGVLSYQLELAGAVAGDPADFIYDAQTWEIRYLAIEQKFEQKALRFFILPQSVQRITWATRRIVLRELQPVSMGLGEREEVVSSEAAA